MPPVHSGMVPSALAAFSAPIGVRSAPRRAASCGLTAAHADPPRRSTAAERQRMTPLLVAAARPRRGGVDILLPGEAGQDVPGADDVGILETAREHVAPGGAIREPARRLDLAELESRQLGIAADRSA